MVFFERPRINTAISRSVLIACASAIFFCTPIENDVCETGKISTCIDSSQITDLRAYEGEGENIDPVYLCSIPQEHRSIESLFLSFGIRNYCHAEHRV